ncbi:MAG: glutamine--fructose-6-phosphate transaminase (isomerizing) [Flavobacteriales bacterium]|nr:glutamine--fructose-6-phosphate transaminase (isomerizing) [Flavobacteriales bacterium]NDC28329.1 glutamine--fructose-6-phosphate transaminase (isomerizing) [Crocinitomicaceae bacterium]NDC92682.1 glutamine--fructose-6-phosphate transaminase (isomerizing) [Flavobacteriales bacterium]
MCGIVAYIGKEQAFPIILKGLKRLEYRGYDSAGIALINQDQLNVFKKAGKVSNLEEFMLHQDHNGTSGIGHTRWATHGAPTDTNAHPHVSMDGSIALIHNGIIENYNALKQELIRQGYLFKSETDTEVLVHLVDFISKKENVWFGEALRLALLNVVGAYAIVAISKNFPGQMVAARKSSPLVVGIGENGDFYLASDATPIVEYTKRVVYLEDEEIAVIKLGEELKIYNISDQEKTPYIQQLELELEALEKGGYDHFMLKEIHEQPRSIHDCFRGRLNSSEGWVSLGGLKEYEQKMIQAKRLVIVACGTSWHAGLVGEYLIEELARINVEVEYASEFRYRNPIISEEDVVIAISQSGETADTLAALELAKSKGATILGICNVVGSSISRITDAGSYTHAGPEIGVASTKAFTAQVTILSLLALSLAHKKGTISESEFRILIAELEAIPEKVQRVLENNADIEKIALEFKDVTNALYLGRGSLFPVALEGALKLKEISYIHAEGYPAAEMKHGPIALIDENMPIFVIATQGNSYEKVVSNIQEVKARKGKIIAIVTEGDEHLKEIADYHIEIPKSHEFFVPILATIPFQLISYHIAVMRGCNVDQPRNLAKSVTVE